MAKTSVKLDDDVIETARIVAAYRGEPMADVLGDILRPVLARMEQEAREARAAKETSGKPTTRGKRSRG